MRFPSSAQNKSSGTIRSRGGITTEMRGPSRLPVQSTTAHPVIQRSTKSGCGCRFLQMLVVVIIAGVTFTVWQEQRMGSDGLSSPTTLLHSAAPQRRVAVCFFGLTRSLPWTLPSIQQRVLGVLENAGMGVEVFVHTYHLRQVNNERAGEEGIDYSSHSGDYRVLKPVRSLVTDQDDFDLAWPNPSEMTHYNFNYPPELAPNVLRNMFRAYWSMSMVWGLMAQHASEHDIRYDAVVLARPDVWFHVDCDLPSRTFPLPERTVFLPGFDVEEEWKGRKNDRFGYGSVTAMRVMMNRIGTFVEADVGHFQGEIDSEWLLGHHLRMNNVVVNAMNFSVTRVRLTGEIPLYDQGRVQEACDAGVDDMACEIVRLGYRFPTDVRS